MRLVCGQNLLIELGARGKGQPGTSENRLEYGPGESTDMSVSQLVGEFIREWIAKPK